MDKELKEEYVFWDIKDRVWQLGKRDVVPICNVCYHILKDKDIFNYIGNKNYRGLRSEQEYRLEWQNQDYCFFCYIYETLKKEKFNKGSE